MKVLALLNPFGAPVYHEETVSSTMDTARQLAHQKESHGTVITVDFQEAGRGRLNRSWFTERGRNLIFTILLRYGSVSTVPEALTLRAGLAVALAIEDLAPSLAGSPLNDAVKVKWPNDIMIGGRKAAGILTEGDGKNVFIGAGVNVAQREFPAELGGKAGSIIQAYPGLADHIEGARFILLEYILARLYDEIEKPQREDHSWRERLERRLYKKGETVLFIEGLPGSERSVEGTLSGIGSAGELLIVPRGEKTERAFVSGELRAY